MSGYSIPENFSVLNNYSYENKSVVMSALDWVSTPCRNVFGGRKVDVPSQTFNEPDSSTERVKTAAYSILLVPIAVLSSIALLIKMISLPWIWQKAEVTKQSARACETINAFTTAVQNKEDDKILSTWGPAILRREGKAGFNLIFSAINRKINKGASWEELGNILPLLPEDEKIMLLDYAVKVKLNNELENGQKFTDGPFIYSFILSDLNYKSVAGHIKIYEYLLNNSLKITNSDSALLGILKMDIAHYLFVQRAQMQASQNQFPNLAKSLDLSQRLAYSLQNISSSVFRNIQDMNEISQHVSNWRQTKAATTEAKNTLAVLVQKQHEMTREQLWGNVDANIGKLQNAVASFPWEGIDSQIVGGFCKYFVHLRAFIASVKQGNDANAAFETFNKDLTSDPEFLNAQRLIKSLSPSRSYDKNDIILLLRMSRIETIMTAGKALGDMILPQAQPQQQAS